MNKITTVINGSIGDTARSIALKVDALRDTVTKQGKTADIYSLYNNSLMLLRYECGCLKKMKLFNSCEVEKVLRGVEVV